MTETGVPYPAVFAYAFPAPDPRRAMLDFLSTTYAEAAKLPERDNVLMQVGAPPSAGGLKASASEDYK